MDAIVEAVGVIDHLCGPVLGVRPKPGRERGSWVMGILYYRHIYIYRHDHNPCIITITIITIVTHNHLRLRESSRAVGAQKTQLKPNTLQLYSTKKEKGEKWLYLRPFGNRLPAICNAWCTSKTVFKFAPHTDHRYGTAALLGLSAVTWLLALVCFRQKPVAAWFAFST